MGIYSAISKDVEELVKSGYDDKYIFISVGDDSNVLTYIINYFRKQYNIMVEKDERNLCKL